ncbi:type II secretion system protein [Photobacterium lutimaris]|uniref:Type II secretion system protein n=1 Tax=Photobacterium lutimaris TaxID=388278 RepID=A0A2T3J1N9_9GAMM|nr:type II secretion system protein [Photobacterium lutimaris]PSU35004.1 type II secretion system protein [Photobacterium lutimaris]TDR77361.1 MSHA pilin protein MshA [Photobacterium lutimaris]
MKKNGFTLIELVVVIVILGILAVTAAPRFLNLQTDARNSALEGLKGAVESGLEIGFGKMAMAGLENRDYITNLDSGEKDPSGYIGEAIPIPGCELNVNDSNRCIFRYGYPESDFYTITTLVDGINRDYQENKDWGITKKDEDNALIITDKSNLIYTGGKPTLKNDNCYLRYNHPSDKDDSYNLEIVACQ